MITKEEFNKAQKKAAEMIKNAGIRITEKEEENIEIVDFGLSDLFNEGAQILTFFNTERVSAKVIALFPKQTEPEHWHPHVKEDPGKEETIRVIDGTVYFYLPGDDNMLQGFIPKGKNHCYTVRHELVLKSGDQITVEPGTKHWFQAGKEGAVLYTFSTCARDILDKFSDHQVNRVTEIID